jgi:hypothetical protein
MLQFAGKRDYAGTKGKISNHVHRYNGNRYVKLHHKQCYLGDVY